MKTLPFGTFAIAVASFLAATPAAAIPDGSTAKVKVASTPSGALATTDDGSSCRTPCTLRLPLESGGRIHVTRDGYEPQTVSVGSHVDAGVVARDVVSSATDPFAAVVNAAALAIWGSGSYKSLDSRRVNVQLFPSVADSVDEEPAPTAFAGEAEVAPSPAVQRAVYGPVLPGSPRPGVGR